MPLDRFLDSKKEMLNSMNNIKDFINYGVNRDMTVKDLRKMPFGLSAFYLIEIIICLILGGKFLFIGFIVATMALFAIIWVFVKTMHLTLRNYFKISGVLCLTATINFTLLAFILCSVNEYGLPLTLFTVLIPFIIMSIYFLINLRFIRNGVFEASKIKKVKHQKIKLYAMLGGIAGISIARILFSGMSQSSISAIIIVCIMMLTSIISFGIINFYKLKLLHDLNYDENF